MFLPSEGQHLTSTQRKFDSYQFNVLVKSPWKQKLPASWTIYTFRNYLYAKLDGDSSDYWSMSSGFVWDEKAFRCKSWGCQEVNDLRRMIGHMGGGQGCFGNFQPVTVTDHQNHCPCGRGNEININFTLLAFVSMLSFISVFCLRTFQSRYWMFLWVDC